MTTFGDGELLRGRYRLEGQIGAGAAGLVLAAHDVLLDRAVVVKIVRAPSAVDGESAARLEREARAAARIGHPHIVQVLDLGRTDEGWPFVVMELVRGDTLDQLLIDRDRLDVALAVELHLQLLDGLAAAHDAGVLHRDVKPPNVIVSWLDGERPFVKLLDFGLAALEDASAHKLTQTGAVVGSPAYLAPELLMGQPASARVDIYATGVSLYECLAGRAPFHAPSPQALRGLILGHDPPPLATLRADVPPALSAIVERAMAKDPGARFNSARTMREALLTVLSPSVESVASPAPAPAPPRRRSPWLAGGAGVALVVILAGVVAAGWTRPDSSSAAPPSAPEPTPRPLHARALPSPAAPAPVGPEPAEPAAIEAAIEDAPAATEAPSPSIASSPVAVRERARTPQSSAEPPRPPPSPPPEPETTPPPAPAARPRMGEHLLDPFE